MFSSPTPSSAVPSHHPEFSPTLLYSQPTTEFSIHIALSSIYSHPDPTAHQPFPIKLQDIARSQERMPPPPVRLNSAQKSGGGGVFRFLIIRDDTIAERDFPAFKRIVVDIRPAPRDRELLPLSPICTSFILCFGCRRTMEASKAKCAPCTRGCIWCCHSLL